MIENTKITILLPTSGPPNTLERTLQSLGACERPSAYRETIVVENGPPMGAENITQNFAEMFPIRYIHFPERGKSQALNNVLQEVIHKEDFVLFTDDDVRFNAQWIVKYQHMLERYGPGHYFGGAFGVDYEEEPPSLIALSLPRSALGLSDEYYKTAEVIWYMGFNWGAFRKDLKQTGWFNPLLGPGSPQKALGQESEMQRRMFDMGMKPIFIPGNYVWHYVPKQHLTSRWIFQRRISAGVLSSYLLKKKPLELALRILAGVYDVFGLLLFPVSKQRFYKHYYNLGNRIGIIKGLLSRSKI